MERKEGLAQVSGWSEADRANLATHWGVSRYSRMRHRNVAGSSSSLSSGAGSRYLPRGLNTVGVCSASRYTTISDTEKMAHVRAICGAQRWTARGGLTCPTSQARSSIVCALRTILPGMATVAVQRRGGAVCARAEGFSGWCWSIKSAAAAAVAADGCECFA